MRIPSFTHVPCGLGPRRRRGSPVGVRAVARAPREGRKPDRHDDRRDAGIVPGAPALHPNANKLTDYDPARLMAGHVLRRVEFGPSPKDMDTVLRLGVNGYIEQQLNPSQIDDSALEAILPNEPKNQFNTYTRWRRWYLRMVASKRQLQEKMALVWHEHFATSINKVGYAEFMSDQEDLFRRNALGSFRQMLIEITKDRAMVIWLDNNYNDGNATDDEGNPVPPNENYARELLQLFSMGPEKMNPNGTIVMGGDGRPVVNYTETDVRETARALTGFYVDYKKNKKTEFEPYAHDAGNKTILGRTVVGRSGADGARKSKTSSTSSWRIRRPRRSSRRCSSASSPPKPRRRATSSASRRCSRARTAT